MEEKGDPRIFAFLFFILPPTIFIGIILIPLDKFGLVAIIYASMKLIKKINHTHEKGEEKFITEVAYNWYNKPLKHFLTFVIGGGTTAYIIDFLISNPESASSIIFLNILFEYLNIGEILTSSVSFDRYSVRISLLLVIAIFYEIFEILISKWIMILDAIYWLLAGESTLGGNSD